MIAAVTPRYGAPEVLEITDTPEPTPGEHDVLIEVNVSVVTAGDRRLRAANFPGFTSLIGRLMFGIVRPRRPVQGTMFAGRVVGVGAAVSRFAIGDRVFGSVDQGAYAERIVVPETGSVATLPDSVDDEQAVAIPYGAGTALQFLRDMAALQPGERLLVLGASGGVGRYAVQLGKHLGAEVTAVCSAAGFDVVRQLGADHVIDHHTTDFSDRGERYDVIFDVADASSFSHSRGSLTASGRYLTLYVSVRVVLAMAWTAVVGGPRALFSVAMPDQARLVELADLLDQDVLRAVIAERFPLSRLTEAHAAGEAGVHGEIIVEVAPPAVALLSSAG